ncbi:MAG: MlaD family protein [Acidobacteria bacterium]|nr:MlaD family protein [Acidobacteriota bacterium]
MGSPRLATVGAFVLGGLLLFAVGLFLIGDRRLLFSEQFEVEADFGNVAGVEIGTGVRLSGLPAGEVIGIEIPGEPGGRFVVRMRVREDLRALVRTDSEAAILSDGLLGSAYIQLRGGSGPAPLVADGGALTGVDAVEIADLIAEGRETFRIAADEMTRMRADVSAAFGELGSTVTATNRLVADVGAGVRRMSEASAELVAESRGLVADVRTVMTAVADGQDEVVGVLQETRAAMEAVRESAVRVEDAVARFSGPGSVTEQLLDDAGDAMRHARNAIADMADNAEALKRNWLFRGFFAERGFYNLDELTLDEYRALEADDRYTVLRVWIAADRVFEAGADGSLALRADAGRRIDEAMGDLLRYPRNSPLVVEGYSTRSEDGPRMNDARRRAELIHDHVARAFRRPAGATSAMPLGAEAPDSPSGDGHWDGVALTLFVETERLAGAAAEQ